MVGTLRNAVKHPIVLRKLPVGMVVGGQSLGNATPNTLWLLFQLLQARVPSGENEKNTTKQPQPAMLKVHHSGCIGKGTHIILAVSYPMMQDLSSRFWLDLAFALVTVQLQKGSGISIQLPAPGWSYPSLHPELHPGRDMSRQARTSLVIIP